MTFVGYLFAVFAGAMNTVQAGANAQLRKSLDQPVLAGMAVYATGLAGLLIVALFWHFAWPSGQKFGQTPWWAWTGGVLSIFSTMAGVLLARKLGSATFTSITVTCSLICSVLLDHLGWVGFEVHRAGAGRLTGCALLITGVLLVSRT